MHQNLGLDARDWLSICRSVPRTILEQPFAKEREKKENEIMYDHWLIIWWKWVEFSFLARFRMAWDVWNRWNSCQWLCNSRYVPKFPVSNRALAWWNDFGFEFRRDRFFFSFCGHLLLFPPMGSLSPRLRFCFSLLNYSVFVTWWSLYWV